MARSPRVLPWVVSMRDEAIEEMMARWRSAANESLVILHEIDSNMRERSSLLAQRAGILADVVRAGREFCDRVSRF